jgi:REP element-mobilizing transposase RayT
LSIANIAKECRADVIELEVMPDHVHLLVDIDPQFGIHRLVKPIKGRSSRLLRRQEEAEGRSDPCSKKSGCFEKPLAPKAN